MGGGRVVCEWVSGVSGGGEGGRGQGCMCVCVCNNRQN
jgi:hypothetical protein